MELTGEGSFLTKKLGPLPMWAWMGLGLGGALALASWRNNKAAAGSAPSGDAVSQMYALPQNLQPAYTFVDADTSLNTYAFSPPGGGRPPLRPNGPPSTPPPPDTPAPPPPATAPPPPAPRGEWVTVVKYANGQPAGTPSTLWGIAEMSYGAGKGGSWRQIWDAPQNAATVAKRGHWDKIQPGDKFWVPK